MKKCITTLLFGSYILGTSSTFAQAEIKITSDSNQSLSELLIAPDTLSTPKESKDNQETKGSPSTGSDVEKKKLFFPGMQWFVPEEAVEQGRQKEDLVGRLENSKDSWIPGWAQFWGKSAGGTAGSRAQLENRLNAIPPTGRVILPVQDPYVMEAQPALNPKLTQGQQVIVSHQPTTVSVVNADGGLCTAPFRPGVLARHYALVCSITPKLSADWAWLIQPDGKISKVGLDKWNFGSQVAPAPGSWIWAPSRRMAYTDEFSGKVARFIATLGPSGSPQDALYFGAPAKPIDSPALLERSVTEVANARNIPLTPNDWGVIGLLQTPSARMAPAGAASFTYSYVDPYQRYSFGFQPLSWLEFGFRYTRIDNQKFGGPASDPINFAYQDKSLPIKIKLLDESYYLPQVALGAYDITGTGLFSGQYVVGSKRYDRFDVSLGMGWGYNGARQSLNNPFGKNTNSQGGNYQGDLTSGYFTGKTALFGGVQYQTAWDPLVLKAELDGNNYLHEPLNGVFYSRAPFPMNVGATYLWENAQVSVGYERGNQLMLSITFTDNLGKLNRSASSQAKTVAVQAKPIGADWFDANKMLTENKLASQALQGNSNTISGAQTQATNIPIAGRSASTSSSVLAPKVLAESNAKPAPTPVSADQPPAAPAQETPLLSYSAILASVSTESGWEATQLRRVNAEWWVDFANTPAIYIQDTLQHVIALLHRDAPGNITTFRLRISNKNLQVVEYAVDRQQWMLGQTQLLPPHLAKNNPLKTEPFTFALKVNKGVAQSSRESSASESGAGINVNTVNVNASLLPNEKSTAVSDEVLAYASPKRYDWGFGLGYQQIIAGPNNFGPIFAINLMGNGTAKLWTGAWASGTLSAQGPNNLGHYKYTYSGAANPGNVPRVRTYLSEYWNSSVVTMPNLQLTQVKQVGDNHFFSAYGGMLEWMFGGVGGEYLYRPVSSPVAVGVNINRVKQRAFDQNLQFMTPSYLVNTGHATAYWDTGLDNILVKASIGQYLAGDKGGTLDISKVFNNGVQIGVYGTKTNMSTINYGEGGSDKGIYLSIPFDAFLNTKTNSVATFMYQPYYKDGGAFLQRQYPLYDLTRMRDQRALNVGSSNQSESLMPVQPF